MIWRWRTEEIKMIDVYKLGSFADEGHAIKDVYYGYEMDNPDYYNYVASAHALTMHHNSGTPRFTNVEDFRKVCGVGVEDCLHQDYPAVEMEGKEYMVGRQVDWISSKRREVHTHYTWIKITAQHTTGGTKNFIVTVTYSVEGNSTRTRVSAPISLAPGQSIIRSLSVPGKGKWANILSVDIREKKKPAIPQPPRIQPGTPPGLPPTPPLPGPRRPRSQSEESPE